MSEPETYYAVMGVSPGATPDEIRRRYRELARKLHPDLNPDLPDASERLLRVNEAYNILSDPVRRASYDLTLRDRARRTATARAAAAGWAPASSGVRGAPAPDARRQQELERQRQEIQKKLEEARQAYARGHLGEARRLCEEILSVRRVGAASELLGDVYSRQGRLDLAVHHYTLAAQMLPHNSLIMAKLNRVMGQQGGGEAQRAHAGRPRSSAALGYGLIVTCLGAAVILFLMFWMPQLDRTALGLPFASEWTFPQITAMVFTGMVAGWTLAAACWVRRFDRVMLAPLTSNSRYTVRTGVVLGLFSVVFLPLALGVYLLLAFLQDVLSGSILVAFSVAFILTLGFVQIAPPAAQFQTGLFGGNLVFLAMLMGWFLGDLFRPSWSR